MQPYPPVAPDHPDVAQDVEHLRQLSVAHYVYAALQCFFVIFSATFFGIALAMIARPEWFHGAEPPAILLSGFFMSLGLAMSFLSIGFAYCSYRVGRSLKERRHYGFCKLISAFNCLSMPVGTVLGVFTLVVLSRPRVKAMFGRT